MNQRLESQVKALEMQLNVLKVVMKRTNPVTPSRSFSDLFGIFRGKFNSSAEEIDAAQYDFEWEDEEEEMME